MQHLEKSKEKVLGKVIANNFRASKGKLPWPVERGVVTLGYGDQAHPVHRSLIVHNSGVEITTEEGSNARAVFDGEVTSVIVLSPVNKAVISPIKFGMPSD